MESYQATMTKQSLHGARPAALKPRKESYKIKKSPAEQPSTQRRPPVIIYVVSPKIIHANPSDFMSLVQRLTGAGAGAAGSSSDTSDTSLLRQPSPPARNSEEDVVLDELVGVDDGERPSIPCTLPLIMGVGDLKYLHDIGSPGDMSSNPFVLSPCAHWELFHQRQDI